MEGVKCILTCITVTQLGTALFNVSAGRNIYYNYAVIYTRVLINIFWELESVILIYVL